MTSAFWLQHCPGPRRPRPNNLDWDVFISYRSVNRRWAIALRDLLVQKGFDVFLDQYVLVGGEGLTSQLGNHLRRSAAGVLIWSAATADSKWVEQEYDSMNSRRNGGGDFDFHFVVATLDGEMPDLLGGTIYADFSAYPDGPSGKEFVRLSRALIGEPLDEASVERIASFEDATAQEPTRLRAMKAAQQYEALETRALAEDPCYSTSAVLPALAAEYLIDGGRYDGALRVIDAARARFKSSIRLRQLKGLALRRTKRTSEAMLELEMLRADGHHDPETLGPLAAAWADRWEQLHADGDEAGARDALERSRNTYAQAFQLVPSDTYVGLNAAAKSAMLGDHTRAKELAERVLAELEQRKAERKGAPADDYWERVSEPEARMLLGQWKEAADQFHDARVAFSTERGSISSTARQIVRLLSVLDAPEEVETRLREEFEGYLE